MVRLFGAVDLIDPSHPTDSSPATQATPLVVGVRRKSVLAILALHAGQLVTTDLLAAGVWDDDPPRSALNTLQSHVSHLRRLLPPGTLTTHGTTGYTLDIGGHTTDLQEFTHRVTLARSLTNPFEAVSVLDAAVLLASQPALADVREIAYLARHAARIDEQVAAARLSLARACLDAGDPQRGAEIAARITEADPYNEAAHELHILGLYRQGAQAAALAAHRDVVRLLDDELGIEPGPSLRALELALLRQDPAIGGQTPDITSATSAATISNVPHQPPASAPAPSRRPAPRPVRSLVGREADLATLTERLADHHIVTISGPGGVGKTHLASTLAAAWEGGIGWVDLAPLSETDVERAVVEAAGLGWRDDVTPADAFATALTELTEPLLLLLDSAEHVVDAVAHLVAAITAATDLLTVLVTTQRSLRIPGEYVHTLPPLAVGAADAASPDDPAVRLLLARMRDANPGWDLGEDALPHVYEICRELDGLPLALELAAATLRSMTVAELAEGLDDRFELLTTGGRAVAPRHQTLRGALEWTHEMLGDRDRDLVERLGVFVGGASLNAARAVCADATAGTAAFHNTVYDLVDASLVRHEQAHGRSRLTMHASVRAFAAERLAQRPDADDIRARHAAAMADLVASESSRFHGPHGTAAIEALRADDGNLAAAIRWAATADPTLAAQIAAPLWWYWFRAGRAGVGRDLLRTALGDSEIGDRSPESLTAAAGLGYLAWVEDDYDEGARLADLVLSVTDSAHAPDAAVRALALSVKARAVGEQGRHGEAHTLALESCALFAAAGDVWGTAWSRRCAASVIVLGPDPASAMSELLRARDEFDDVDDAWGAAGTLDLLASTATRTGDPARALGLAAQAVAEYRELGDSSGVRYGLQHGAEAARANGDLAVATELAGEALAVARQYGYPVGILRALEVLADVAEQTGSPDVAAGHRREAERLKRRLATAH